MASQTLAQNKRARFDYEILETLEAGIVLTGSEVKSLRRGRSSINESHAGEMTIDASTAIYLFNANIAVYEQASVFGHEARRPRKLLMHKKEMNKLLGAIRRKGLTVVPISMYFNTRGIVKVQIGLARGRKNVDKREMIKDRDWQKQKSRELKNFNNS